MGYGNPPGKAVPTEGQNGSSHPTRTTEATGSTRTNNDANSSEADLESFSFTPLGYTQFGLDDAIGTSSYLHEFENPNTRFGLDFLANTELDSISYRDNSEVPIFSRQSPNSYPGLSMAELFETGRSNTATASPMLNNLLSEGYQEPENQMKFMPVSGYAIKEHGAEAKISGLGRSQMHENFSPSSTSISLPTAKFPLQHVPTADSAGKVDGSFLTLGIGGDKKFSRNNHFSSQEISSKLEEAASSQPSSSHAVQKATNPWSLQGASNNAARTQTSMRGFANSANSALQEANNPWKLAGVSNSATGIQTSTGAFTNSGNSNVIPRQESASAQRNSSRARRKVNNALSIAGSSSNATRIQTSVGGLPSSANDLIGRISTSDRGVVVTDNTWPDTSELHSLQTPQADERAKFLPPSDSFRLYGTPSSMPPGFTPVSYPGLLNSSHLALQQVRPSEFSASQPPLALQQVRPPQFSTSQSVLAWKQVRPPQFTTGQSILVSQHSRPSSSSTSPSNFNQHQNLYSQHERSSVNVFTDPVYERHGGMPIVHPGLRNTTPLAEATRHDAFLRSIQPVGQLYPRQDTGSADAQRARFLTNFPPHVGVPFPRRLGVQPNDFTTAESIQGPAPFPTAAQFNTARPFPAAGQHLPGIAAPSSIAPRDYYSRGQGNRLENPNIAPQPFPRIHQQTLKRPAVRPPVATSSQRRRIAAQPNTNPYQSHSNHVPGTATGRTPAATPLQIKAPGSEELPLPSGNRCFICRRDLSFTAEGQVYQPTNLPMVAVLPCGHTFHDQCLENITPKDQAKDPPCIPCAIGET